jgi:hypothetical protein
MTKHQPRFRLSNPGAFVASLPAVLGFVPEKSLIVVSLVRGELGAVMRVDLADDLSDQIEHLAELAGSSGATSAVGVVVDVDGALCAICLADYNDLFDDIGDVLDERGVVLQAGLVVDKIEIGGQWQCLDGCGERGEVADPSASPLAAAAVLEGRRLYGRRADVQAVLALTDPGRTAALAEPIAARGLEREEAVRMDPDACARQDVKAAIAAAEQVSRGDTLDDAQLAILASGLTDLVVRDTLYALAVGTDAGPAEALWALLSQTLPAPWRVEALVLLAFSAYARGDGPLAGIALEEALRIEPTHRMGEMLDRALRAGMRPEQIQELAGTGYRLARRLGVRLPSRRRISSKGRERAG